MYSCNFSMNLVKILLASWSIFTLVEEAVSLKQAVLYRDKRAPLAVIKKRDSSLQLAIPHAYQSISHLTSYDYDDSVEQNGLNEKMMIACPANGKKQLQTEKNWKTRVSTTEDDKSTLLFQQKYTDREAFCNSPDFIPSINTVKENRDVHVKHCNQKHADMYQVGYPVSNDEKGEDVQFLSTYKICYSKTKGKEATLYSIHRIVSPDLLFMSIIKEFTDLQPLLFTYGSVLDSGLSNNKSFESEDYYAHQFVGTDDMPNRPWKQTTYLLFNYTTITRNKDLYKGMIRADWYIRLYSYKKNEPLNLYSGTHQKVIKDAPPVDSFWRVILDDAGNAVILVSQHTRKKCGDDYLCEKNLQVKSYEEGGCIYTCSLDADAKVNENLLHVMGSPPLKISGHLDFTLQTDETQKVTADGPDTSNSKPSQTTGIIEFLGNKYFEDALLIIDRSIFKKADFQIESPWS